MALKEKTVSLEHRLSSQLHWLVELSEFLTLRLIDIEEKLELLEKAQSIKGHFAESNSYELLEESEVKVKNINNLLNIESWDKNS